MTTVHRLPAAPGRSSQRLAAIVTGGAAGIGLATALLLAERGARSRSWTGSSPGAAGGAGRADRAACRRHQRRRGPLGGRRPASALAGSTSWSTTRGSAPRAR